MLKMNCLCLPIVLLTACSSLVLAQNDFGSFDDLQGFDPLPELGPVELPEAGPEDFRIGPPILEPAFTSPRESNSVLEPPQFSFDEPAPGDYQPARDDYQTVPGQLTLPELTAPTPDNSQADHYPAHDLSEPELDPQWQQRKVPATSLRQPRLTAPQPMSYRPVSPYGNVGRSFQIQVYSVKPNYRYQPRGYGYQPYGGYGYRSSRSSCKGGRGRW